MRRILCALAFLLALTMLPRAAGAQSTGLVNSWHLDHSGTMDPKGATLWVDFSQDPSSATIAANTGQTLTVNGTDPVRAADGTYPNATGIAGAQGFGWTFNGSDAYLTSTIAPPAGSFSAVCVVTPASSATTGNLIGNTTNTANKYGWMIYEHIGDVHFLVSDDGTLDGGHVTDINSAAGSLAAGRRSLYAATYNSAGGDGHAVMSLYADGLAVVQSTTADAPIYSGAPNLSIAAYSDGGTKFPGTIHDCRYWDGVVLSATDVAQLRAQWLGTGDSGASPGNNVSVTSAASPAVQVCALGTCEPFLVDQPVNSSMVGAYGLYGAAAITNLAQRGSFETCAAGHPTGWTISETAGDGTAAFDCDTTTKTHGNTSGKTVLTGTTSYVTISSACITIDKTKDYYLTAWAKGDASAEGYYITLVDFSDAACTNDAHQNYSAGPLNIGTAWEITGGLVAANTSPTNNVKIAIYPRFHSAGTTYVDGVSMIQSSTPTDALCVTDADASAVCNAQIESVPTKITAGSWTIQGTWQMPIDGADTSMWRDLVRIPGTAGNNNLVAIQNGSDLFLCTVYNSAGADKTSSVAAAANANEAWDFKCSHTSDGIVTACAKLHTDAAWTCDATPATGATMDGVNATTYIGSNGSTGSSDWLSSVEFYRRVR